MINGCDVSHHQGTIDYDALRPAVEFAAIKATEGVGYTDPQFARNWSEAQRVGLVRLAYHFARPDLSNSALSEAMWFARSVPLAEGDGLMLDFEVGFPDPVTWCLTFLAEMHRRTGVRPLIYLNRGHLAAYDWSPVVADDYGLWLAAWDGKPDRPDGSPWPFVAMKQYTSSGSLPGIRGRVDLNVFYGSREQLLKYGKPAAAEPPPAPVDDRLEQAKALARQILEL